MEPLSEAALGVLRDKTIADYLLEHCCGTTAFSKLDHGQKLLDHITQQFKLAGLPVPQTYMKSVDNVCDRVKKFLADKKGDFKKEVDANCELVRYVLALRGIDTKKGLLAAIATAAAPATAAAADAPTAAPRVGGSGHDKSGPQKDNPNRYTTVTVTTLNSKVTKDAQKAATAVEQQKASDAAAAEARKLEQIEAAENKAKLERIAAADANPLGFKRVGKAEHQAALMDKQFEVLREKLKVLNAKLSEEKIVPIFEPVKHMSDKGYSTTSLSARPSFMEMMRILTTEGGVKPNQLNLVCNIVYAAFFEKQCEDKLPSVPCMVDWFDDLGEKDCELMIAFMTGVSAEWAVHIMSDSSRRSKAERHGVVCAMWDARTNMPFKCVAGLGTVDSCAGEEKAKVTYKILAEKGVKFEFTAENGWSFVTKLRL